MLDEIAIQQTFNSYTEGVGRADWDQVMSTFIPDRIGKFRPWECITRVTRRFSQRWRLRGSDGLFRSNQFARDHNRRGRQGYGALRHPQVRKYGNSDEALEVFGFYNDELVRTPEGWKFTRRTFKAAGIQLLAAARTVIRLTAGEGLVISST